MMTTMVDYWDRLKPEMDARGMGITALAKAMGVSFQAIAKVRDGGAFGTANHLKAAKLFGLNPEWLSSGKGDKAASAVVEGADLNDLADTGTASNAEPAATTATLSPYAHALGLMFDALPDDKLLRSKVYARLTAMLLEVIDPIEPELQQEPVGGAILKKLSA